MEAEDSQEHSLLVLANKLAEGHMAWGPANIAPRSLSNWHMDLTPQIDMNELTVHPRIRSKYHHSIKKKTSLHDTMVLTVFSFIVARISCVLPNETRFIRLGGATSLGNGYCG